MMLEIVEMLSAWSRRWRLEAAAGFLVPLAVLGFAASSGARADELSGAFVDLPNVKLWVTDSGGTGDPVVLLHANTGTSENWEKQLTRRWCRPAIASSPSTGPVGGRASSTRG